VHLLRQIHKLWFGDDNRLFGAKRCEILAELFVGIDVIFENGLTQEEFRDFFAMPIQCLLLMRSSFIKKKR